MSLTLDALTVLDAIDRKGSFAAAAEEIYRVPSAISYTVQKLEQDLDITIFDRSGHRAALTPAGKALLEEGRHLLRAAHDLENHVKRISTGWEAELSIAVEAIISLKKFLPLVQDFYRENSGTRIQIREEVLAGAWDALVTGRADLVIGASGDGLPVGGYSSLLLGEFNMVFAVAPDHPLADSEEPISSTTIMKHRAVAIADTSRQLAPRSTGLLTGQDVLTVPDMESKIDAQINGLGIGYIPAHLIEPEMAEGKLIAKKVENEVRRREVLIAWRSDHKGKALKWFIEKLEDPDLRKSLLSP
ncbi:LysR family transcriptional regulator [Kaarinaea lacus]